MSNVKKVLLFVAVLFVALVFKPSFSNAATQVNDESSLLEAIQSATKDETLEISLEDDIQLTKPIEISEATIVINGKGHTISKADEGWNAVGANGTLITSGIGAKVTLSNMVLENSQKYGAQAYNGGYLILDGVTISDCGFGGVIVNAGTVEVKNLTLNRNGGQANNGIEIAKGFSISTGDNQPTLIMNGTLTSTENENVVYIAINDTLEGFEVSNTENTTNKILVDGNGVVVTDQNNKVLYRSNEVADLEIEGKTLTEEIKESEPTPEVKPEPTPEVKPETQKDVTPKTGLSNSLEIALLVLVTSIVSIAIIKNR